MSTAESNGETKEVAFSIEKRLQPFAAAMM
jgi:hypothetical protein